MKCLSDADIQIFVFPSYELFENTELHYIFREGKQIGIKNFGKTAVRDTFSIKYWKVSFRIISMISQRQKICSS